MYLIRKSKSYGEIKITEDYEVKLFDEDGRAASASASASEVELLALSFILAIHSVSGYESPLVVDTLLARTSGEQRLKVEKSCLNLSKEKIIYNKFIKKLCGIFADFLELSSHRLITVAEGFKKAVALFIILCKVWGNGSNSTCNFYSIL